MFIYIAIFFLALFYYYWALKSHKVKDKKSLFIFLMLIATFIGLGDMIGGFDRYIYGESFDTIADETWTSRNYSRIVYLKQGIEWGYLIWQILLSFITENRYIYILLTTYFIYFLCYKSISRYMDDYPLACIVFIGFFYYFTMTYLREVISVCIAWQGVKYLYERKPIKFFLVLLIAASFHGSVVIFALMYFVPLKKFSKDTVLRFLAFCLILGLTPLPMWLISVGMDTTGKLNDYTREEQGFRLDYVIEVIVITWIIFQNYSKIRKDKKDLVFLNMCYAFCGILFVFMRFGQGGRFGWPFFIGLFYIFTKLCNIRHSFSWMRPSVIMLCFVLFMRITYFWGNTILMPYKTFLTDGIPSAPNVYERFEYDVRYTNDKFYRPAFTFENYTKNKIN